MGNGGKVELTKKLAEFIVNTVTADIPDNIYENSKIVFLDWLGCALVGHEDPLVEKLIRYTDLMGGEKQATILTRGTQKTVLQAALINGAASHVMDFDDTTTVDIRHASVGMYSSLLALAEWKGASGIDFLKAHIVGFKVAMLMGALVGMKQYNEGWHTTSTIGRFASAAACAKLLGLTEEQTIYALALAGTLSGGMKIVFGSMTKAFHAGNAARDGLRAALLGQDNYTTPRDFLEGTDGYMQVFGGTIDGSVVGTLGKEWDFDKLAQKYHASCHFTHSAIESALWIAKNHGVSPDDVEKITIHSSQLALNAAGKLNPTTALEGKFSLSYCVANALVRGDTALRAFTDEKVNDPSIREYMKKVFQTVDLTVDPMEARVDVETKTGNRFSKTTDIYKEVPDLDEKRRRIVDKFSNICEMLMKKEHADGIKERVLSLERVKSMSDFVAEL